MVATKVKEITVQFKLFKETKNAFRYDVDVNARVPFGSVYISKEEMTDVFGERPEVIEITMRVK